jgi:hypothetical protein
MAFEIASSNLVLELTIVLLVFLGWQFALAEVVGGMLMVAIIGLWLVRVTAGRFITTGDYLFYYFGANYGASANQPTPAVTSATVSGRVTRLSEGVDSAGYPYQPCVLDIPAAQVVGAAVTDHVGGCLSRMVFEGLSADGRAIAVTVPVGETREVQLYARTPDGSHSIAGSTCIRGPSWPGDAPADECGCVGRNRRTTGALQPHVIRSRARFCRAPMLRNHRDAVAGRPAMGATTAGLLAGRRRARPWRRRGSAPC